MTDLPVAVFVYNRPAVLDRTLSSLRDGGAERLIVFSDGPRTRDDDDLVRAVRGLVRRVDWADCMLVERERNLGLSRSITRGLDWVFEHFERAVVIEDDVAVAPEYLSFAEQALDAYADDARVGGVTGFRVPIPRRALRGYGYDAFFLPRFFTWGWATWRRAWQTFVFDRERLLERLRDSQARLEAAGADLPHMVRRAVVHRSLTGAWDVYAAASMVLNDQLFLVPTWNMVENVGFESGTHTIAASWRVGWETEHRPSRERYRLPPTSVDAGVHKAFCVFTENPQGWTARRLLPRPARALLRRIRGTYDVFRPA